MRDAGISEESGHCQMGTGIQTEMVITVEQAEEHFLGFLHAERSVSSETWRAYKNDLDQFRLHLQHKTGSKFLPVTEVTPDLVRSFMFALPKDLKSSSRARKLSALRSFFNHLLDRGWCSDNPAERVASPKVRAKTPAFLDVDDTLHFLNALERSAGQSGSSWRRFRNWAMYECLYSIGARVSELVGLSVADVDFEQGLVRLLGKGKKERVVPIGKKAREALRAYLDAMERQVPRFRADRSELFLNASGGRLTARSVHRILRAEMQQCGLWQHLSPHGLRHTFATHILNSGREERDIADLRAIQEMLGHASLSTTQRYTHVHFDQLQQTYDRTHPRSRLKQ